MAKVVISVIILIIVVWIGLDPATAGSDVHTFVTHLARG
jgi:hypothetical protein